MPNYTFRERIAAALESEGYRKTSETRKYWVYKFADADSASNIYLGKAGATRIGRTVSESRPCVEALRQRLMKRGLAILQAMEGKS